mmetsp:Transcript_19339/g.34259  ORF Transcript_19339/g.34259 Transcript_19339/m.34259 type:complete len:274 (+) Transcript_19339:596-1417(+)
MAYRAIVETVPLWSASNMSNVCRSRSKSAGGIPKTFWICCAETLDCRVTVGIHLESFCSHHTANSSKSSRPSPLLSNCFIRARDDTSIPATMSMLFRLLRPMDPARRVSAFWKQAQGSASAASLTPNLRAAELTWLLSAGLAGTCARFACLTACSTCWAVHRWWGSRCSRPCRMGTNLALCVCWAISMIVCWAAGSMHSGRRVSRQMSFRISLSVTISETITPSPHMSYGGPTIPTEGIPCRRWAISGGYTMRSPPVVVMQLACPGGRALPQP